MYKIYQRQTLVVLHSWSNTRLSPVPRRGCSTFPSAYQVAKKNIPKGFISNFLEYSMIFDNFGLAYSYT